VHVSFTSVFEWQVKMGLIQLIKDTVYNLFVKYQIVLYLIPVLKPFAKYVLDPNRLKNHEIKDRSGNTLPCTKIGERLFPPFGEDTLENIKKIKMRKTDVMLCGYPKTGCHWVHEILHMLVTGHAELTKHGKALGGMIDMVPQIVIDSVSSPRVLNTHLLFEDLPHEALEKKTKIILTARNPKDTVVSFYNHTHNMKDLSPYDGTFDDFFDMFIKEELPYGSYFDFYNSWDSYLKNQGKHPVLLVKFEDNKANPLECVKTIANFLELEISDEFAEEVVEKTNFNRVKAKRANNVDKDIFRKGTVGDWTNWLSKEQDEAIDQKWRDKMMGCTYQPTYT